MKITYFVKFFKQYKFLIFFGFLFLIGSQIAVTIEPIYLRNIIDTLTTSKELRLILIFLVIYFGLRFSSILFEFFRDYVFSPVIMGVARDIENSVFEKLLKLPVGYHADQKSGAASRAVARGSRAISFVLDFSISQLLPPIFELIFVTFILLRLYDWYYGIITLVTVIFYTWFTIWGTEKRQKYREEGNLKDDLSSAVLVDSTSNIEAVKYFNNEGILFNLFKKIKQEWFELFVRNNRLFALIFSGQGLILLIGLGIILVVAVSQALAGIITVGDLVLVTTYIVRLSAPIATLGFVYGQFKNSFVDLKAMAGILSQEETILEPEKPAKIKRVRGKVEFKNVSFTYFGRKEAIKNLNLVIKPGQKVAFVGPSGAGKSTIAKLLFRLYEPEEGEIKIDGVNIKDLSAETRRKIMGIVPQEAALFNDTIKNNIKFGNSEATEDEVIKATKTAQIHDFIKTLPLGYNTLVGERGVKISGGERQRVAIARAIIKNPKILVFDEATSNLDSKKEQEILKTLKEVAKKRTTIAIAHRLSTIVDSDIIYVLKNGQVIEQGPHQQLLKQNRQYAKLWRIQSRAKRG